MKPAFIPFSLVVFFIALTQCTTRPPRAPGDEPFSGGQSTSYRRGYHLGFQDGKRRLDDDFERHFSDYKTETRDAFEHGYHLGHDSGLREAAAGTEDKDRAYNDGYEAGRTDFENSRAPSHERHRARYTAGTEADFRRGYVAGFDAARGT